MRNAALAVVGFLAVATIAIASDRIFWLRLLTIQNQTPLTYPSWIAPKATVSGGFKGNLPNSPSKETILSEGAIRALVNYAEQVDSFSLIVHHGDRIQFENYWQGLGPDDVTETYSMAKSIIALIVGVAISDGIIGSIDDPVTNYIPEWIGSDRESITIRHALEHSSGLEHFPFDLSPLQNPYNKAIRFFIGPNMENALLRFQLTAAPGTEFNYNSANTQLLMLILQRSLRRPYANYVSEKLWEPLGAKPAQLWLDRVGGMPKAYSFFQARPRDWLRVGLAIKNEGVFDDKQIIPADWLRDMRTPSKQNPKYGLHLWLGSPHTSERFYNRNTPFGIKQEEPFLVDDVVFFDGGGGQRVYVAPSADLVVVRTGVPSLDWDDGVIPNIVLRDLGYGSSQ